MADRMNFQDALDSKVGDIERPPNVPQGIYSTVVKKQPSFEKVGKNDRYETCDFMLGLLSPTDNVDETDLAEYGDITNSVVRKRFMFDTEDEIRFGNSMHNLKRFIEEHLQVDGAADMSLKQALANCINHQCLVDISWRPDTENPEIMYVEAGKTAPID